MLWTAFGILFYIRFMSGVWRDAPPLSLLLATLPYPPLIAIAVRRPRPAVRRGLLAALVLLYLLPFAVVGTQWDWMPWTVAAGVLCALPARTAWPLFTLAVAAAGAGAALLGYGVYDSVWFMIVTADDGLIVFGLAALVGTVARLHDTREELARPALLGERLRLDRELWSLLGGKLQAIAFRLRKAAGAGPAQARDDVTLAREDVRESAALAPHDIRENTALAQHDIRESAALARHTLAEVRAVAAAYHADPLAAPPAPIESPRLARSVLLAVLLIQCVLAMTTLYYYDHADAPALLLAAAGLAAIVALQVMPQTRVTLAAQGLLILLPLALAPGSWDRVLSYLTGKVLLNVRPPRSWAIAGVILAGHLALMVTEYGSETANVLANLGGHVMLAWLVYSLGRIGELVVVLDRARRELAAAAVRRERTRIAQDLHDVLGFSLSAVALKGEVAERLLATDPARARTEIAALVSLVERALAELDAITGDGIELRLATEAGVAREVLASAGIDVTARIEPGPLPPALDTALAAALRETVTNVLRHSRARTCDISVTTQNGAARLRVVNDGAAPRATAHPAGAPKQGEGGSGLCGLVRRTGGGRVEAGHRADGTFEVIAEFALDPPGLGGDPEGVDPVASPQLGHG
ncbi:sensor histidine kinase [Nonomuraea zeae]|nr:histidine kinase [Nonomuraea zeae]